MNRSGDRLDSVEDFGVAGEAPELLPQNERLKQWLTDLTDAQLGVYMLLAAGGVGHDSPVDGPVPLRL